MPRKNKRSLTARQARARAALLELQTILKQSLPPNRRDDAYVAKAVAELLAELAPLQRPWRRLNSQEPHPPRQADDDKRIERMTDKGAFENNIGSGE